jgi:DNA-binding FadR family transcriptional regulator
LNGVARPKGGSDVPLQTVEPVRLYRQIAGQIATLIDSGEFAAGSRLPPERELAVLLGVSRTSVREALISLEIAGRVEVRVGTGIFVRAHVEGRGAVSVSAGSPDSGPGPFDLLAARALVEGEIAALAARNIGKQQIAALRETIVRMRTHGDDFEQRNAADRAFHVGIAEAAGNEALVLTVAHLWDLRRGDLWTKTEQHFHTPALREMTLADHAAIVTALVAGDADAARDAMRRHLSRVAHEFQRSIDAEPRRTAPRKRATPRPATGRTRARI